LLVIAGRIVLAGVDELALVVVNEPPQPTIIAATNVITIFGQIVMKVFEPIFLFILFSRYMKMP
jgi:hypothetical protein